MFLTLFALLVGVASATVKIETVADLCAKYLGKDTQYSFVLKDDGTFSLLSSSVLPSKVRLPVAKLLSSIDVGPELLESVPEIGELDWSPSGGLVFSAISQFITYQIQRDGYLTIEMILPPNEFGHEVLRHLMEALEREKVTAMVSGNRTQVSVYRLSLKDGATQRALKGFLAFMRDQRLNPE